MRIEELLTAGLSTITDTFKDKVPEDYTGENVIRYAISNTTSSLFGDDKRLSKTRHIQVDLYTKGKRFDLEEEIEAFFDENYLRIVSEKEMLEEGKNRKLYSINYEE